MNGQQGNRQKPGISAVVVSHNSGDDILRCLAALYAQTFPLQQIIVVDNNSSDGSPLLVQRDFPEVEIIILERNSGPAVSRNVGIEKVTTELVLFIDDDVFLEKDALEIMERSMASEGVDIICPRILLNPDTDFCQCDGVDSHFLGNMRLRNAQKPVHSLPVTSSQVDGSIGACNLVRIDAIRHAGGYNDLFFIYFEDHEFNLRMNALGHRFVCQPAAKAFHKRGRGTPGLSFRTRDNYPPERAHHTIRNRWITILLVYKWPTVLLLFPAFLMFELAAIIQVISRGWFGIWIMAIKSIWNHRLRISEDRRFIQRNRVISDYDLLSSGELTFAPEFISGVFQRTLVKLLSILANFNWWVFSWLIK